MSMAKGADPADMMSNGDYSLPAEVFVSRRSGSKRTGLIYRRFDTAVEAIDFAVGEFPTLRPDDLVMTVENKRFNLGTLRALHRECQSRDEEEAAEPSA